jgi:hypothetical protein
MQITNIQSATKAFVFLCLSLVIFSFAYQQSWELFASKEGGFTVMSPATLEEKVDTMSTHLGELIQHTFYYADYDGNTDNFVYMISYHDFPEEVLHPDSTELQSLFLDNSIEQAVSSLSGELVYQDAFYAPSGPGRIYKISYNEGTAVVKSKIFLVGDRFYNARVFGTSDKDPNNDMNRFLDSFRPMGT